MFNDWREKSCAFVWSITLAICLEYSLTTSRSLFSFSCLNSSAHSVQLRSQCREEHPFLRLSFLCSVSVSRFLFDHLTTFCMLVLTPFCQSWLLPLLLDILPSLFHTFALASGTVVARDCASVLWAWGTRVLRNDHRSECFNLLSKTRNKRLFLCQSIETGNWVAPSQRKSIVSTALALAESFRMKTYRSVCRLYAKSLFPSFTTTDRLYFYLRRLKATEQCTLWAKNNSSDSYVNAFVHGILSFFWVEFLHYVQKKHLFLVVASKRTLNHSA